MQVKFQIRKDGVPELYMQPEAADDHHVLERVMQSGVKVYFGRHAETGKFLHVRIPLVAKEC